MRRAILLPLRILAVALCPLAGLFAGCAREEAPPPPVVRKTVPKVPARPEETAKAVEAAAARTSAVVSYSPAGKRDPFVPFIKKELKAARSDVSKVPPLQRYELGELKFVGMIWGPKGAYALVEDAEGKGYTVTVGTKVGREGGTVTRITDGEVFLKEEFLDYAGAKVVRESSLKLQSAGGK